MLRYPLVIRKVDCRMRLASKASAVWFLIATAWLSAGIFARQSPSASSGLSGTWKSDLLPFWTLVLKTDGAEVTGGVNSCSSSPAVEIIDAHVQGNAISFKCRSLDGDRTLMFEGIFNAGEISLTWKLQVREGGRPPDSYDQFSPTNKDPRFAAPPQFTMKRVADGAGEVILDRLAERRRTTRPEFSPVTFDRLLRAEREPHNWLTYSGTLHGQRHSQLTQITTSNVKTLELAWIWDSQSTGRFQASPIVADGVLYTVRAPNDVVALDALTGEHLWTHKYTPAQGARATGGGGFPNRGVAILGSALFMGTLDAHLLAIDARTGKLLWNTAVADSADPACKPPDQPAAPCYVITHAPLIVKDKVIVGTGGGDGGTAGYGIRGFVAAFDAATGKEVWRFHTIPVPGEARHNTWSGDSWKTGGAGVWITGSYDPQLNLTYWGTGNPVPTNDGSSRLGDNLYSSSLIALDADTGRLKWHYQFTPHDEMDWDSAHVPVLADVQWQGRQRNVVLVANKNGLMYMLDRETGQFLMGKAYVQLNWLDGFDETGRPIVTKPKDQWTPKFISATNWHPPSYSPKTSLFYISSRERSAEGAGNSHGAVQAFDVRTGEQKWGFTRKDTWFSAGVLTTASDLLFTGTTGDFYSGPTAERQNNGQFFAFDARTGAVLWHTALAGSIHGTPMTYSVAGTQHIAITGGDFLFVFALPH